MKNIKNQKEKNESGKSFSAKPDFMTEQIKKRPINGEKLAKRFLFTVLFAVIFGAIASVVFIVLQPYITNLLSPEETVTPAVVSFPEDTNEDEMSPEEMLYDYMQKESLLNQGSEDEEGEENTPAETNPDDLDIVEIPLTEEQIDEILSQVVIDRSSYQQMYSAMTLYIKEMNHFMVTITGVNASVDWLNTIEEREKSVSGVIVAQNGVEVLVLADYTNLESSEYLELTFYNNVTVPATLKTKDSETNLAILSVQWSDLEGIFTEENLPVAYLGSSYSLAVSQTVFAIGSPLGTAGSVGYGIISSPKVSVPMVDGTISLIQTDIYCGSAVPSGVLMNVKGQVVGVLTSRKANSNQSEMLCAIGVSEIKKRIEKMSNDIALNYVGITGVDVTAEAYNSGVPQGGYITSIEMNSPAMMAGLQVGDVIVAVGDREIFSFSDYVSITSQASVGDEEKITIKRQSGEEYRTLTLTVVVEAAE